MIPSLLGLSLAIVGQTPSLSTFEAPVMGTRLEIRIAPKNAAEAARAPESARLVIREFERVEALVSEWKSSSPIGLVNDRAGGDAGVVVPAEAFALVVRSLDWSVRTGGAFDPTFASVWGLWRFDAEDEKRIPTRAEAAARAATIDYRRVILDHARSSIRLASPKSKIGLGGIAKGYGVDRAVAILRNRGHENFLVKAGGELYVAGLRFDRPWVAGIQDPRDKSRFFARLALQNSAFTTSGDYEHFLIVDGVRYHHIIDPKTGYPAVGCRSVTIVAAHAEHADALSTSVFVMGPKRGMAFVESLPNVEAVIVDAEGRIHTSKGLAGKLVLEGSTPKSRTK